MLVPFHLRLFDRPDLLLERFHSATRLQESGRMFAISRCFKDEMGERPPMQIIEVYVPVQAGTSTAGDDVSQRNDAAVLQIRLQAWSGRDELGPPDRVGIGIDSPQTKLPFLKSAGGK